MLSLITQAFNAHAQAPAGIRVTPSIPILYFGDYPAYARSPLRIITVGLNPSNAEFPADDPFSRFPDARIPSSGSERALSALNSYFKINPYWRWFSGLEPLLEGFDASFKTGRRNTTLHTDLLSPVATDPTWSGLSEEDSKSLSSAGVPLWHALVTHLRPHIVLISVAEKHLERIKFDMTEWTPVHAFRSTPSHTIHRAAMRVAPDWKTDFLFGQAKQTPFGGFLHAEKRDLAGNVKGKLTNW